MNVLVCIKQVPAKSVPMDKANGVLDRSKAGGRMNPWDSYALEVGLRIAKETGGKVTAFSMGPKTAEQSLREALSMGADDAVLLCDKAFAGADVFATAYAISQGIKALGDFDIIVCGQQTTDGDTAQLPFSLAVRLDIPAIGWVKKIEHADENSVTLLQELSFGTQKAVCKAPFLMAVGDGIGRVRIPTLREQLKAKRKEIKVLSLQDLENKDPESYGLIASPTRVVKIHEAEHPQKCEPLEMDAQKAKDLILKELSGGDN